MDVIGNNISNVNTAGYKTSRVIFQDIFSQNVKGGMANQDNVGGTNPIQIGLGIRLSTVDVMHTPAPFQRTDNPLDMMINGEGFFIVEGPDGNFYTRLGNFYIDESGYLVNSQGYYVMTYSMGDWTPGTPADPGPPAVPATPATFNPADPDINAPLERVRLRLPPAAGAPAGAQGDQLLGFSVDDSGTISVMHNNVKVEIARVAIGMFSNPSGLEKAGNSLYIETPSSGAVVNTWAFENGAGRVDAGGLEMSNVDLADQFTDMIVTQRGFQANSRIITVSDTMLEELVNLKR